MTETFMMKLNKIRPSQLYICSEKLNEVMKTIDPMKPEAIEPIPIKKLGSRIVFVDGHTRAFAAFLHGFPMIPVYWEEDELDWDAYTTCVEWCKNEGIQTIADLKDRVVSQKDYEILWYRRCEEMQQGLANRKLKEEKVERTVGAVTNESFTVLDFMTIFKERYPTDWKNLVNRFGQLGSKRRYAITTYFSNRLDVYSKKPDSLLEPITHYKEAKVKDYRRTTPEERKVFGSLWIAVFRKKKR